MEEYKKLIMGIVSGFSLMLLNNEIVHESLNMVLAGFDPNNFNTVSLFLTRTLSQMIILLSFIGTFVTIISSILILRKILKS